MESADNKTMHEIRNCLNALRLNSAYLERMSDQDVLDCMDGLCESADRLSDIMLELSGRDDLGGLADVPVASVHGSPL